VFFVSLVALRNSYVLIYSLFPGVNNNNVFALLMMVSIIIMFAVVFCVFTNSKNKYTRKAFSSLFGFDVFPSVVVSRRLHLLAKAS